MLHLSLISGFKQDIFEWYRSVVHMKDPGPINITKYEIREVVLQTEEPDPTKEDRKNIVKILGIIIKTFNLDEVVSKKTHLRDEEKKLLIGLLKEF